MKFKPEDFEDAPIDKESNGMLPYSDAVTMAEIANAKLQEWLKEAEILYLKRMFHPAKEGSSLDGKFWTGRSYKADEYSMLPDTHTCKIVCIEEIDNE